MTGTHGIRRRPEDMNEMLSPDGAPERPLLGEAPKGSYRARDGNGVEIDTHEAVFPILRMDSSQHLHLVGTAFFIADNGIFATAKHVVTSVFDPDGVPLDPLIVLQFAPGGTVYQRAVHRVTHHRVSDVAVGVLWPVHHKTTGKTLPNKLFKLVSTPPPIGASVATYAHPKTRIVHGTPQEVHVESSFFVGTLVESFPEGRDHTMLPGPCFQTSMVIHGGASGGPVVGPDGRAFGINSTGFEDDFVSFVSPISEILDLAIPGIVLPGESHARDVTVRELSDRKLVVLG